MRKLFQLLASNNISTFCSHTQLKLSYVTNILECEINLCTRFVGTVTLQTIDTRRPIFRISRP